MYNIDRYRLLHVTWRRNTNCGVLKTYSNGIYPPDVARDCVEVLLYHEINASSEKDPKTKT